MQNTGYAQEEKGHINIMMERGKYGEEIEQLMIQGSRIHSERMEITLQSIHSSLHQEVKETFGFCIALLSFRKLELYE